MKLVSLRACLPAGREPGDEAILLKIASQKTLAMTLILFLFSCGISLADIAVKDFSNFKKIPVLDNGRLKPLDTYARSVLTQFSGKDHYERQEASAWLAAFFFNPESTSNQKVFLINNPELAIALGIHPEDHRRYSFEQMRKSYSQLAALYEAAQKITEKERSLVEGEIIRVYDNVNLYAELAASFTFTFPQKDFTIRSKTIKANLGLDQNRNQWSFIELALKATPMEKLIRNLENEAPSQLTPDEMELIQVASNLFRWSSNYKDLPLSVIPSSSNGGWLSPWDALRSDFKTQQTRQLLMLWNTMAASYLQSNEGEFAAAAQSYMQLIGQGLTKEKLKSIHKFPLELFYHASSPFTWAIILYILTFIFFVTSFSSSKKIWYQLAMMSTFSGFAIHVLGLALRIIIMGRPPVSSLYETFIFVGFITVFLGLAIEHFNRQWLGFVTAAISGTALLFIAGKYSAEGDTLKVLIAVLNSNFWLATHVTSITMGYGATCVGGVLGHIWLIQAVFGKDSKTLDKTCNITLGILGVALTLTFLGTNLGGIWADQSWGRFWGWDPKENGALMIVLWIALLFHAKVAQMIGPLGLAIGAVLGMMVVMWAWFGVNLLSVGLHSYGFTSGITTGLFVFVFAETVFILGAAGYLYRFKNFKQ